MLAGPLRSMIANGRTNADALAGLVRLEVDRALGRLGLATADEVEALGARVRGLEGQLRDLREELGSRVVPGAVDRGGR